MVEFLKDLWDYMLENKKLWLAPILLVLVLLGALVVFAEGSAIAPFILSLIHI